MFQPFVLGPVPPKARILWHIMYNIFRADVGSMYRISLTEGERVLGSDVQLSMGGRAQATKALRRTTPKESKDSATATPVFAAAPCAMPRFAGSPRV